MADNNIIYDDAAEAAKFLQKRKEIIEQDSKKPFDPEAILEVRHLRKCFPLKKTITGNTKVKMMSQINEIIYQFLFHTHLK